MASSERNQTVGVEETRDGAGKSHTQYAGSRQRSQCHRLLELYGRSDTAIRTELKQSYRGASSSP